MRERIELLILMLQNLGACKAMVEPLRLFHPTILPCIKLQFYLALNKVEQQNHEIPNGAVTIDIAHHRLQFICQTPVAFSKVNMPNLLR